MKLFPLNGCRGLASDVIDYAVDAFYLVGNAAGSLRENLVGDGGVFSGHKVGGDDRAERNGVIVGSEVAHNADRAHIGKDGEVLPDFAVKPRVCDFLTENSVLILSGIQDTRLPDVLAALEQAGLTVTGIAQKEDWRCVTAKRRKK